MELQQHGARYSSVVRAFAHRVRWVIGSILLGGPIELFLIPASAPPQANNAHGMCYP